MLRVRANLLISLVTVLLAAGCGGGAKQSHTNNTPTGTLGKPSGSIDAPTETVTAEKLTADFKSDAEMAEKRYGQGLLVVEGTVKSNDGFLVRLDNVSLTLESSPGTRLFLHFKPEILGKDGKAPKLTKGQKIKLGGKFESYWAPDGLVHLYDCELLSPEGSK